MRPKPLGSATAQSHTRVEQLLGGVEVLFFRKILCITQGSNAARHDAYFNQRIGAVEKPTRNGVASFVVGNNLFSSGDMILFFFRGRQLRSMAALKSSIAISFIAPRSNEGSFVTNVGNFGAGKTGRLLSKFERINIGAKLNGFKWTQNLLATHDIWLVYRNHPVETTRAKKADPIRRVGWWQPSR